MQSIPMEHKANLSAINRIAVTNLFGRYSYELNATPGNDVDFSKLVILYGDNGSGKTTILSLLYHLMSPAISKGHRTFIAGVPFEALEVDLSSGIRIMAQREHPVDGPYTLSIKRRQKTLAKVIIPAESGDERKTFDPGVPGYYEFCKALSDLEIAVYFLSDDRRIQSDLFSDDGEQTRKEVGHYVDQQGRKVYTRANRSGTQDPGHGLPLRPALNRVVQTIRQQALNASDIGDTNVNQLYIDIARTIVRLPDIHSTDGLPDSTQLIATLKALPTRNEAFVHYGLSSALSVRDLIKYVRGANTDTQSVLARVLSPFIEGLTAKLNALQGTLDVMTTFVETLNRFYRGKSVRFHLREGLTIVSDSGEELDPDVLSSGEKQLLLLFCNTLLARDQASIFVIDEPELSLNVKWQRELTQALLELVSGGRVQFILATHSMELLTHRRRHVLKLEDRNTEGTDE